MNLLSWLNNRPSLCRGNIQSNNLMQNLSTAPLAIITIVPGHSLLKNVSNNNI